MAKEGGGDKPIIIIKKVKVAGHGGAHGGSWKVAYSDFITALMAFFLLMWLLAMVSPEKRAAISDYFNNFSLFEGGGAQAPSSSGAPPSQGVAIFSAPVPSTSEATGEGKDEGAGAGGGKGMDALQSELKQNIAERLADLKDQVMVDGYAGGVRVQMVYNAQNPMFSLGSAELTDNGKKALSLVAESLRGQRYKIVVEGHTDAKVFQNSRYTNWELSLGRAASARQELVRAGLSEDRLLQVAGYAATQPLVKEDPDDPRNRRISVIVYEEGKHPFVGNERERGGGQAPRGKERVLEP